MQKSKVKNLSREYLRNKKAYFNKTVHRDWIDNKYKT